MSIITGKYELSIWKDVFTTSGFVEEKVITIGSDIMQEAGAQHRAYDI
jgi:hypothetical protein